MDKYENHAEKRIRELHERMHRFCGKRRLAQSLSGMPGTDGKNK